MSLSRRVSKLVITRPPHGTSQECSKCSRTHPDNRRSQTEFVCQSCGFSENPDFNAFIDIKKKVIRTLLAGELSVKQEKRAKSGLKKTARAGTARSNALGDGNKPN